MKREWNKEKSRPGRLLAGLVLGLSLALGLVSFGGFGLSLRARAEGEEAATNEKTINGFGAEAIGSPSSGDSNGTYSYVYFGKGEDNSALKFRVLENSTNDNVSYDTF